MSHIFISLDRRCTVVGTVSAQNGYKGSRNGRFLPPSRTERGPVGLAAPGRLPRGRQLALLPPGGRARCGPERSRELGQGGLHEVPGPRAVRGARAGGARAVRRVGRADRGRARGTHGAGAQPPGVGVVASAPDRADHPRTTEGTFLHRTRGHRASPLPSRTVGAACAAAAHASARAARASCSSVAATAGTWARSGRVSATISRRTAGSSVTVRDALGPYGLDGQLGQDGDAQARAHQADHRRIVVGREVDAGREARALAHLHQLAPAARAAGDPRLGGEFADGDGPDPAQPVPLADEADQPVRQQRPYDQVVPLRRASAPAPRRSGRRARCRSRPRAASRPSAAARPPPGRRGCRGGRRAGRRGRSGRGWSCRWGRTPAGPGRRAGRRWRRPPPRPR